MDIFGKSIITNPNAAGSITSVGTIEPLKKEYLANQLVSRIATQDTIKFSKFLKLETTPTSFYQYGIDQSLDSLNIWANTSSQTGVVTAKSDFQTARAYSPLYPHYSKAEMSMQATLDEYHVVGTGQEVIDLARQKAYLQMLIRENCIYVHGDNRLNSNMPNGLLRQHQKKPDNINFYTPQEYSELRTVIDLRGAKLSELHTNMADVIMAENYATDGIRGLVLTNNNLTTFNPVVYGGVTQNQWVDGSSAKLTSSIAYHTTTRGNVLKPISDIHISKSRVLKEYKVNDPNQVVTGTQPAIPNVTAGTNVAASDATYSKFVTSDAGTYYYAVSAFGDGGQSKLALINATPVTVTATQSVDITFVDGAGSTATQGYVIYRSLKNAPDATGYFYPIITVSTTELAAGYDGAAAGKVRDRNRTLPMTETCFMLPMGSTKNMGNDVERANIFDDLVVSRLELLSEQENQNGFSGLKSTFVPAFITGSPMQAVYVYHHYGIELKAPTKMVVFRNVGY